LADERRGFGFGEILLVAMALCVMVAVGIAAAAAFTQSPSRDQELTAASQPEATAVTPLQPVVPSAEPEKPAVTGSRISDSWVADMSGRTGIGAIALQAYGSATLRIEKEQPACRLGWTTLAGIGGIESLHGTDKGSYLLPAGQTSQRILGPALDGTDGNAAIAATPESVQWHGDSQWDHAVGPMQFIPSTWERWQSDGNDDGVADPSNVFDAAYAAGRYLCASGGDLRTGEGWTRAIFSYNHSDDYVRTVLSYANFYAAA
jgi:membrane-bound lytic murein transglycosylase B